MTDEPERLDLRSRDIAQCATRFERDVTSIEDLIAELRAGRIEAVDLSAVVAS